MPLQLRVPMEVYPFNFPIESDANNGKDFPIFRDGEFYSTVRFLILSVMLSMGLRRAVQPSLLFRSRLLAAQHCYQFTATKSFTGREISVGSCFWRHRTVVRGRGG